MLSKVKNRKIAAVLAFSGVFAPIAGFHKFYLRQPIWGTVYILLSLKTPIPWIASALEGIWYLMQEPSTFDENFNPGLASQVTPPPPAKLTIAPEQVSAIADAVRELDQLRQEGLISEYEFEQKRRQMLDQIQ